MKEIIRGRVTSSPQLVGGEIPISFTLQLDDYVGKEIVILIKDVREGTPREKEIIQEYVTNMTKEDASRIMIEAGIINEDGTLTEFYK